MGQKETLYQLWATDTATGEYVPMPMFPRMNKEAVEQFAFTVKTMIASGKYKAYSDPQVVPHLPILN